MHSCAVKKKNKTFLLSFMAGCERAKHSKNKCFLACFAKSMTFAWILGLREVEEEKKGGGIKGGVGGGETSD